MTDIRGADLDRDAGRRLAAASDERRRDVERIMHDGVQQHMALLGLKLSMLQNSIVADPEQAVAMCGELREEIQGALRELRAVAHLIYPAILENEGLGAALHLAADRLGVRATVDVGDGPRLPRGLDSAFYFCCLEALDNVARHAGSDAAVTVRISSDGAVARFEVQDDGRGFVLGDEGVRSGLQHIEDRVRALDGSLEVTSAPEGGTCVTAAVPVPAPD